MAGALTSQTVASTAINNWFVRRRGTALAIFVTIMGLSGPVYVPAASWLIQTYGWRTAVTALGLLFLVVPLPLSLLLRHRPEDMGLHPIESLLDRRVFRSSAIIRLKAEDFENVRSFALGTQYAGV